MDTHTVLCRARNLIDRGGWVQRARYEAPYCLMGALGVAGEQLEGGLQRSGWSSASVLLKRMVAPEYLALDDWNDAPGRTKAEVLDLFDRAIAATAPEPDLASLNLNENGGAKDWNALEARVRV